MAATRLVFVRHGESNASVNRIVGGPLSCSGLSELGRRQAEALAARLALHCPTATLVSSSYPRAIETAAALAQAFGGVTVREIGELGEQFPGPDCDGLTFEEYVRKFGETAWHKNPYENGFPGGETVAAFQHRVATAVSQLATEYRGREVVVSCHGGVIDRVMRLFLHAPPTGMFEIHTVNCSITEFTEIEPGSWRLHRYNDTGHLSGLPSETVRANPMEPNADRLELVAITAATVDQVLRLAPTIAPTLALVAAQPLAAWARAAVVDGTVVGCAIALPPGSPLSPSGTDDGWFMWRLIVDRVRQRAGYGRRIVDLARAELTATRPGVALYTCWPAADDGASRFARALGFTPVGEAEMAGDGDVVVGRLADRGVPS